MSLLVMASQRWAHGDDIVLSLSVGNVFALLFYSLGCNLKGRMDCLDEMRSGRSRETIEEEEGEETRRGRRGVGYVRRRRILRIIFD